MEFIPFVTRCKAVAMKETRCITVNSWDYQVPPGKYHCIESYCAEDDCDCRKVMINMVTFEPSHKVFATIGYGWELFEFYKRWAYGDKTLAIEMAGTYLEKLCEQSQYSGAFLDLFNTFILDKTYKERLKRHYKQFKHLQK